MASNSPQPPGQSVFRLRIQLRDVDPVIWRRVLVPGSVRMAKLAYDADRRHGMERHPPPRVSRSGTSAMGCTSIEWPEGEIDEKTVSVLQALRDEKRFIFEYDFGDSWEHDVVVEELTWSYFGLKYAVVLDGENACPPDDVGGARGYGDFLEAVGDPDPRGARRLHRVDRWPLRPHRVRPGRSQRRSARRCADQLFGRVPRLALVERSRKLSVPVSMMWALKVSRSTMAATSRGSPIT